MENRLAININKFSTIARPSVWGRCLVQSLAVMMLSGLLLPSLSSGQDVDFEKQIAPIFSQRCYDCHGPDTQESGLRLDRRQNMLVGGDSGLQAVVPGQPQKSYLMDVVNHVDEDMAMPPDDDKLPQEEIELLHQWIQQGAVVPGQMEAVVQEKSDHWSFQPLARPSVPGNRESQNPIDAFLLKTMGEQGLSYSPPVDPRTLIRRASIVLTGLPPTAAETKAFIAQFAQEADVAYTALVDRLIASPHFGERWAQHWLDVIRWAESNGSESNMYRKNAWYYRDYVIRAFNEDKPYDRFIFEQIAGDAVGQGDATGFLVAGPHVPSATVGREPSARRQARADRMDEILQTVGASAMGITIGCARCHNHKFDPVSIKDYYELAAVFEDVEFGGRQPGFDADHPRQRRGQSILTQLEAQRRQLRAGGPWEENWTGFKEIQIPAVKAQAVRFKFDARFVRIDELEIFAAGNSEQNLALATEGTTVEYSESVTRPAQPIRRINDGKFGNDAWMCRVPKDSSDRPWVQFNFKQVHDVNRFRLSTNREDFWETDYLIGLNKLSFNSYVVEVQDDQGVWTQVVSSSQLKKNQRKDAARAKLLQNVQALIGQYAAEGPQTSFIGRFIDPQETFVLGRGSPENPRDRVFPAGLNELGGELGLAPDATGQQRRAAFANWLIEPEHPLTARVAVNRLWSHVFGQGIVATPSDFGAAGAPPTHPQLLDWLAGELIEPRTTADGQPAAAWSMKHLIRLMVLSQAFRQSSLPDPAGMAADAGAALLWRFPPKRMEAEVIRDSILLASGKLDRKLGGIGFRIHNVKKRYAQWEITDNHGQGTWRRMLYQERMRRVDDQMFTAFDFPDCGQVRPKRPVSTTPLQALNLMNSEFAIQQSQLIAGRAQQDAGQDIDKSIDRCFELLLGRMPDQQERDACRTLAADDQLALVCRALINSNEFAFLP